MAPKRRAPPPAVPPAPRRSALAKQHDITTGQETSIRESFSLFSVSHPQFKDSKEGVIRREDVRRCLIALDISIAKSDMAETLETLDPEGVGFVPFRTFFALAAIHLNAQNSDDDNEDGDHDYSQPARQRASHGHSNQAEISTAYALFTAQQPGPITLAHLRRVAKELREEVSDELLRDMICEANGDAREGEGWRRGVGREEFEEVMERAGVF